MVFMEIKFDKKDMEEEKKRILEERIKHKKFIAEYYKAKDKNWTPVNEDALIKEKFSFLFSPEELKSNRKLSKARRLKFIDSWVDFMKKNPNSVWSKLHADFVDMVYRKLKE